MNIIDVNIRIEIDNYVALHTEITDDTHSNTVDELIELFERLYKYKRLNESLQSPSKESSTEERTEDEAVIINLKKSDLDLSYYEASDVFDFCKKHKIKIEEPRSQKGLFESFIITLATPKQKMLFYGKYVDRLNKIADLFASQSNKVTNEEIDKESAKRYYIKAKQYPEYDYQMDGFFEGAKWMRDKLQKNNE